MKFPTLVKALLSLTLTEIHKGEAISVTGHRGPWGCESSRLPYFLGPRQSANRWRRPTALYLQEGSWYSFLSSGPNAAGGIRQIEKSNGFIGNRTRDLPARSIVPQPTGIPRASKGNT
jgi:hypothetical protein